MRVTLLAAIAACVLVVPTSESYIVPQATAVRTERAIAGPMPDQASWYGEWHHGKTTANGEVFDMYALTAAHKKLPFGTLVRVTDMDTGRNVVVRINDRGPYWAGRSLDLSFGAAEELGITDQGHADVRVEVIGRETRVADQRSESALSADGIG
jgi:rare lipoprotein A